MHRGFSCENISFEYELIEQNRKTISVTVKPNNAIIVKTPPNSDNNKVENFLKKRCVWVVKQRRYFSQFATQKTEKKYISGESFRYLGRNYKLLINPMINKEKVVLQKGLIQVYVNQVSRTEKVINNWLREKRNKIFQELLETSCRRFGYEEIPFLKINKLKKRWGSYLASNTVILNPDLIKATKKQIQYVVFHELCHIQHKRHNKLFFSLLAEKMPDWQKIKHELELSLIN